MNESGNNGGFLAGLRQNETLRKLTGGRPDLLIFGAPVALIAVIIAVTAIILASGGGSANEQVTGGTPTAGAATPGTTPTAASAGIHTPIAFSPQDALTPEDLAARGTGEPARGEFTGQRLIIPSINVNAEFSYKEVPSSGVMPNPNGPTDVAYYDFGLHPCCGGLPGKGGNVVLAGHVDYINYGPAVFWDLHNLKLGDRVQIQLEDGRIVEYAIEFNKYIDVGDADWSAIVSSTAEESITLITCGGEFEAGHYDQRQIIWGRRVGA